jgi:hypothetical protein
MSSPIRFQTVVLRTDKTATGIEVPAEVVEALGKGKRPPVVVTMNGYIYRTTVAVFGGVYMIGLSAEHRAASGLAGGDQVDVELLLDTEPRILDVPADLTAALDAEPAARATFDGLSYSNRSWHVLQVNGAKSEETRQRRIARSIETLKDGRIR